MSFRGPGLVWVEDRRAEGRKEEGERDGGEKGCSIWALCSETGSSKDQGTLTPLSTGSPPVNAMSPLYSMKGTWFLPEGCPSLVWETDTLTFIHSSNVFGAPALC